MLDHLLKFDPVTALRMLGFVDALMALAIWVLFRRSSASPGSRSWFMGSLLASLGVFLFSVRGVAPGWVSIYLANFVVLSAYGLGTVSLRHEVGMAPHRRRVAVAVVLTTAVFIAADFRSEAFRVNVGAVVHAAGAITLAITGMQAARVMPLPSVRMIGSAYMVYALTLGLLALGRLTTNADGLMTDNGVAIALFVTLLAGAAAAVYGTLGYIGMALERLRLLEIEQATALASEGAHRAAAEQHAQQLQRWLDERDNLIRVMAHEVRQPLNNASAALQAARAALALADLEKRSQPSPVEHRVQRAQSVLNQVTASLDNTLAATALLASPDRVAQHDADVDLLVHLCLGDIDATEVHRVEVERQSGTRTATMDVGLMRLALRNLLSNALTYSDPDTTVVLRLIDSDEPLALVFEVIDEGHGVDPALAPRLFERGARGHHEQPGHGLGLYVVQRVAELHDSMVEMQQREGGGSIFRFWLAQGQH